MKKEKKKVQVTEEELKEKEAKEKHRRHLVYLLLLLVLLFFSTFGITYTLYKGDSGENIDIITDKILFTYSDVEKGGKGIYMTNTKPISDEVGKNLLGTSQFFDFSITATSKKANLKYRLLVKKGKDSTLEDKDVRLYLTTTNGNVEKELVLTNVSNLTKTTFNNEEYYILYEKTLEKGIKDYSDLYRLRMWVNEDATDFNDKMYSLKVDVYSIQVGD